MKRPTPPDARGVGTKSKTYPGMQEKDPFSFEFVIRFYNAFTSILFQKPVIQLLRLSIPHYT